MTVKKAEVEIEEKKPKTPEQEIVEAVLKRLEKPVQPPPIEETLEKARLAQEQAKKAAHKPLKQTWYCTDCGQAHVQNDGMGLGFDHIDVDCLDGEFVDKNGNPLTGKRLTLMEEYAVPRVESGESNHGRVNATTLAKMKQLK